MNLTGSRVLLTGATGGIGHAIVRALAARGATLTLTGRRVEVLEPLAAEIRGRALAADLADRAAVDRLLRDTGDVDVLVANAALPADGPLDGFSVEEIDRSLDVNLRAPILMAHALAPQMAARGHGQLVFISSLAGKSSTAGSSIYSATKFGLRGFALGLRADLHSSGVGVSTIFPGFIRDAGLFAETGVKLPPGVGTRAPEDVARAVVRAIEKDVAEQDVAPFGLRVGTAVAGIAPELGARVSRRLGSDDIAVQIAAGHAHKR